MQIKCSREKFSQLFALAASAIDDHNPRIVLQNIKMVAAENRLILMATDGELAVRFEYTGEDLSVEEPGEALLPKRLLLKALLLSQEKSFVLKQSDDKTSVHLGGTKHSFQTQQLSDFPDILPFDQGSYYKISGKILSNMIKHTLFAADNENSRYALGGVFFEFSEDHVSAVATDGRRLALQEGTAEPVGTNFVQNTAVCPKKILSLLAKSLADDAEVQIAITENKIYFQIGDLFFQSQLVGGHFPRWRSIIPTTEDKKHVDIIAGALNTAVQQAGLTTLLKEPGVVFMFSSGQLELLGVGQEVGESHVKLPISYDYDPVEIKLDPKFVAEFLNVLSAEETVAFYFAKNAPVLFQSADSYKYVIMPLT
ncbi:MAG: DNA polymerase III subunit beta [Planctomycetia bacterium]|nr:DNA polymerase III subunit beta [Planctomycetia bacterium]